MMSFAFQQFWNLLKCSVCVLLRYLAADPGWNPQFPSSVGTDGPSGRCGSEGAPGGHAEHPAHAAWICNSVSVQNILPTSSHVYLMGEAKVPPALFRMPATATGSEVGSQDHHAGLPRGGQGPLEPVPAEWLQCGKQASSPLHQTPTPDRQFLKERC